MQEEESKILITRMVVALERIANSLEESVKIDIDAQTYKGKTLERIANSLEESAKIDIDAQTCKGKTLERIALAIFNKR